MNYRDEFDVFLKEMVDDDGYAFTAGFASSMVLNIIESLPKTKQKYWYNIYINSQKAKS